MHTALIGLQETLTSKWSTQAALDKRRLVVWEVASSSPEPGAAEPRAAPQGRAPQHQGGVCFPAPPVRSWERTETPALHPDEEWTWPHVQPNGAEVLSACQPPWGRE